MRESGYRDTASAPIGAYGVGGGAGSAPGYPWSGDPVATSQPTSRPSSREVTPAVTRRPVKGAAKLAAILDALPDALLLVDRDGLVVNANAMGLEAFEAAQGTLVGIALLELLPDFDRGRIPGGRREGDQTPGRTKPQRHIARRTDGSQFPVEVTSSNLPGNYGDDLLLLVVRNLSDAVDVEVELRRQQRQTELILRAASEGIVGVDTEGRIVLANPAAAKMLRYRASDLGGKDVHQLIQHSRADGTPLPREECPIVETLTSGRKHRLSDEALWRRDGSALTVDVSTAPVYEGEALVGAVMTFTDQSAVRAISRRNEDLVSILEQELREPLRAVQARLSQLSAGGLHLPKAPSWVDQLTAEAGRLVRLVDDVVEYQHVETGRIQLERGPVDLERLVELAVERNAVLAESCGIGFSVQATPTEVDVDGDRMVQALGHLVSDAVLTSPPGSTVVVAASRRGTKARVEVRAPQIGGSAVHLPIARSVVERHGGTVRSLEIPGRGHTYLVELEAGSETRPAREVPSQRGVGAGIGAGGGLATKMAGASRLVPRPLPGETPAPTGRRRRQDAESGTGGTLAQVGVAAPRTAVDDLTPVANALPALVKRLLVWSEPDQATAEVLRESGYQHLLVRTREEVTEQAPMRPTALFVDPVTGPITRTALQSLRGAARQAAIPFVITAGLGEAPREAAYGADPAVLLRALLPSEPAGVRRSVLLVEPNPEVAAAFRSSLEQRAMGVLHAASENDAVTQITGVAPDLVVLNVSLVRRRRLGVVDWLRANQRLGSTPLVLYTPLALESVDPYQLRSGRNVLFLTERSTKDEAQRRVVEFLDKLTS